MPSLYVTYYWDGNPTQQHVSILSAPLEAALQQLVAQPSLAKPKESVEVPSISRLHLAAPGGQVNFVDAEVEEWIEAGGIERLHAAYHKVCILESADTLTLSQTYFSLQPLSSVKCTTWSAGQQ